MHCACVLCVALWWRVMVLKGFSAFCFPWNNDYSVWVGAPCRYCQQSHNDGHGRHSSRINTLSPLSLHSGLRLWCGRLETGALKAMHASNAAFGECSLRPSSVSISFSPALCPSIHSRLKWMGAQDTGAHYWHHSPQLTEFLKSGSCPKPAAVPADLFIYINSIYFLFLLCFDLSSSTNPKPRRRPMDGVIMFVWPV